MGIKFNPIIPVNDDGLPCPEVGAWAQQKYKLIGTYCDVFTTSMRSRWDSLVYLDLFAGSGYAKIRNSSKILLVLP